MSTGPDLTSAISEFLHLDKQLFNWASSFTEMTFGPLLFTTLRAAAPRQRQDWAETNSHTEDAIRILSGMYNAFAKDGEHSVMEITALPFSKCISPVRDVIMT